MMALYRALLRLYPAFFRAEYGDEMCAIFARRRREAPYVAVVSESLAKRHWPGQDPIGRRFRFGPAGDRTVVREGSQVSRASARKYTRAGLSGARARPCRRYEGDRLFGELLRVVVHPYLVAGLHRAAETGPEEEGAHQAQAGC